MNLSEQIKAIPTGTKVRAVFEGEMGRSGGYQFIRHSDAYLSDARGITKYLVSVEVIEPEPTVEELRIAALNLIADGLVDGQQVSVRLAGSILVAGPVIVRGRAIFIGPVPIRRHYAKNVSWKVTSIHPGMKPEPVRPAPKFKIGDRVLRKNHSGLWAITKVMPTQVDLEYVYVCTHGLSTAAAIEHKLTLAPTDDEIVASLKENEWITFDREGDPFGPFATYLNYGTRGTISAGSYFIRYDNALREGITNVRRVPAPEVK